MFSVTKELSFAAAHRLKDYDGPCKNFHGHNYKVLVTVEAEDVDLLGMVVDFGWLKQEVGGWLDKNWDHKLLLSGEDTEIYNKIGDSTEMWIGFPGNPTAENMAGLLFVVVADAIEEAKEKTIDFSNRKVKVIKVTVYENDRSSASYWE